MSVPRKKEEINSENNLAGQSIYVGKEECNNDSSGKNFDDYTEYFRDAKVIGILFYGSLLQIRYELNGKQKAIFTTSSVLLAASSYALDTFFKNPLESSPDSHISHKTVS